MGVSSRPSTRQQSPRKKLVIEWASFSEVQARVAYKIAAILYRKHLPETKQAFAGILFAHANDMRTNGLTGMYFVLISLAKHLCYDGDMRQWRERYPNLPAGRALHKQRTH